MDRLFEEYRENNIAVRSLSSSTIMGTIREAAAVMAELQPSRFYFVSAALPEIKAETSRIMHILQSSYFPEKLGVHWQELLNRVPMFDIVYSLALIATYPEQILGKGEYRRYATMSLTDTVVESGEAPKWLFFDGVAQFLLEHIVQGSAGETILLPQRQFQSGQSSSSEFARQFVLGLRNMGSIDPHTSIVLLPHPGLEVREQYDVILRREKELLGEYEDNPNLESITDAFSSSAHERAKYIINNLGTTIESINEQHGIVNGSVIAINLPDWVTDALNNGGGPLIPTLADTPLTIAVKLQLREILTGTVESGDIYRELAAHSVVFSRIKKAISSGMPQIAYINKVAKKLNIGFEILEDSSCLLNQLATILLRQYIEDGRDLQSAVDEILKLSDSAIRELSMGYASGDSRQIIIDAFNRLKFSRFNGTES